jgi:hypothetical protein
MNKFVGALLLLVVVATGILVYRFESKAEAFSLEFSVRNTGDGRSLNLSWIMPQQSFETLELYSSTQEDQLGELRKSYQAPAALEKVFEKINGLTEGRPVYLSLIGKRKNGQQSILVKSRALPRTFAKDLIVASQGAEGVPLISSFNGNGQLSWSLTPFDLKFRGQAEIVRADFQGDGSQDLIAFQQKNNPEIRIFNSDRSLLARITPYGEEFNSGFSVVGAILYNNEGKTNFLVVAPRENADKYPLRIYRYDQTSASVFVLQDETYPFDKFNGGIELSVGDLNGDTRQEILTTPIGGTAEVKIFRLCQDESDPCVKTVGLQKLTKPEVISDRFFPYGRVEQQNIKTAVYDLNSDGIGEIVVYPQGGKATILKVFSCQMVGGGRCQAKELDAAQIYADKYKNGLNLAFGASADGNKAYMVVGPRTGGGPHIKVYTFNQKLQLEREFFAYDQRFMGGMSLGIYNFPERLEQTLALAPAQNGGPHLKFFDSQSWMKQLEYFAFDKSQRTPLSLK